MDCLGWYRDHIASVFDELLTIACKLSGSLENVECLYLVTMPVKGWS
jgi:hypothetical protein